MATTNQRICLKQVHQSAKLLKLQPGATVKDCKLAYFKMAKLCHPDAAATSKTAAKHQ